MTDEYRRGYLDALHYAAGVALAFERMTTKNSSEALVCAEFRREIETFILEFKTAGEADHTTPDLRRAQLLALAPRLLDSLKQLIAAIETGSEINPGLLGEYRFVVQQAEGSNP